MKVIEYPLLAQKMTLNGEFPWGLYQLVLCLFPYCPSTPLLNAPLIIINL